jgi:type I restriction-modification system DNA methylase subunit
MTELEDSDSSANANDTFVHNSDHAIREQELLTMLRTSVSEINEYIMRIDSETLTAKVGFLFADQLHHQAGKVASAEEFQLSIKKGAAYLLVNQIVFYIILSALADWPKLKRLENPTDLQAYFDKANLEKKYNVIFEPRIASILPKESVDSLNKIIDMIFGLYPELTQRDLLGKVFQGLIPIDLRKKTGAYYTSNAAADLLSALAIEHEESIILDPACGSGTLLISAYRRKEDLHKAAKPDRGELLQEIFGIDISPFAASLAAIQLSVQSPYCITSPNIVVSDAFRVLNEPLLMPRLYESSQQLEKDGTAISRADIILMNPPFTRYGRLEKSYRKSLERALSHKAKYFRRQMNLQCFFLILTDDLLRDHGRVAAVLPAATFYASYAAGIRKMFAEKYKIEYVITSDVQETFSEQCNFKEVLFIASKNSENDGNTKFVVLKIPLTLNNYAQLADKLRSTAADFEDEQMRVRLIARRQMESEQNWMAFNQRKELAALLEHIYKTAGDRLIEGGKILVSLRRGFETYGPEVFFIPNKDWMIIQEDENGVLIEKNDQSRERLVFPKRFLTKAMRKPKLYMGRITPEIRHYVISIPDTRGCGLPESVEAYLKWGEKQRISALEWEKGRRIRWFSFVQKQMRKQGLAGRLLLVRKFRISTTSVLAHYFEHDVAASKGFYILASGDKDSDMALAAWFNSTIFIADFLRVRRSIEGAYGELMIEDIRKIRCIDTRKISDEKLTALKKKILEISHTKLPPIPCQIGLSYRRELDEAVLAALEVPDSNGTLDRLYQEVIRQIPSDSRCLKEAQNVGNIEKQSKYIQKTRKD